MYANCVLFNIQLVSVSQTLPERKDGEGKDSNILIMFQSQKGAKQVFWGNRECYLQHSLRKWSCRISLVIQWIGIRLPLGTRWQRSRYTWSTSLFTDTSGMQLQTQKCLQSISWEWAEGPDHQKRIWESDSPCHSQGQGRRSPKWRSSWELECRDCGAIPGRGLLLSAGRRTKGMWGRKMWREMPVEESQAVMEARQYCWVMSRGWSHHHSSVFPHVSTGSWESLALEAPDEWINRVGPYPGCPFKCFTSVTTE